MAETIIRLRIDSSVKEESQALMARFGLTMSEAIRLFLHQVLIEKGLPFQVKLSRTLALEHDRRFRNQAEDVSTDVAETDTSTSRNAVRESSATKSRTVIRRTGKRTNSVKNARKNGNKEQHTESA